MNDPAGIELIEVAPGLYRRAKPAAEVARSALPFPNIISDSMPPTEQVDGRFYTSKREFRRVGRSLGLTEVGDQTFKIKPKRRIHSTPAERRGALEKAIAQYKQGRRPAKPME